MKMKIMPASDRKLERDREVKLRMVQAALAIAVTWAAFGAFADSDYDDTSPWEQCDAWRGFFSDSCTAAIFHNYIFEYTRPERHWDVEDKGGIGVGLVNLFNPDIFWSITLGDPYIRKPVCYLGTEKIGRVGRGSIPPKERLFYLGGQKPAELFTPDGAKRWQGLAGIIGFVDYSIHDDAFDNNVEFWIEEIPPEYELRQDGTFDQYDRYGENCDARLSVIQCVNMGEFSEQCVRGKQFIEPLLGRYRAFVEQGYYK